MKQPLAIVGASTRAAAASATRAGFQPLAADLFADADLRRIATTTRVAPYPEGLVDWLRSVEPPAWMYAGALENHPELVDQMAWIAPLYGNPGDVLARIRSSWELAKSLQRAGLLFPETRDTNAGLPGDGGWLVKTYQGASGSGVHELTAEKDAADVAGGQTHVFQRRISGTPCAAVYVAMNGEANLLGVTRQLIGPAWLHSRGFQYAGSIGPWPISDATRATLVKLGNVLAAEFELVGLFGVDFMLDGDEVWTVEVNPRYTASVEIVERATGVKAIALHVAACTNETSDIKRAGLLGTRRGEPSSAPNVNVSVGGGDAPARSECAHQGKAILFAKRDVIVPQSFAERAFVEATRAPWPTLADVPIAGSPIEAGRPVLTIFAEAQNADAVEPQLRDRVVEVERELYT
jgi:uncharacterized protein